MKNLANNFQDALAFSQTMRDRYLVKFYREIAYEGRYVFIDKSHCSLVLQRRLATDTIIQLRDGGSICIEEKIEQRTSLNFALETESCTVPGHESNGWMHYAEADLLLYAFVQYDLNKEPMGLNIYLIDFQQLKQWFWTVWENYRAHIMQTYNRTRIRLVPIQDVEENVGFRHFFISEDKITRL